MIVFLVQAGQEHGIGHLKRALKLAGLLKQETFLLIETGLDNNSALDSLIGKQAHSFIMVKQLPQQIEGLDLDSIEILIHDRRQLSNSWIDYCIQNNIAQIAWDAYGRHSESIELLINPLFYHEKKQANFNSPCYQLVDQSILKRKRIIPHYDVLISFGGGDPGKGVKSIVDDLLKLNKTVCLVQGPLVDYSWASGREGLDLLKKVTNLLPYMAKSDVVITSVGLTLIEALQLQKKCILFNPDIYHEKIAVQCRDAIQGGLISRYESDAIQGLLVQEKKASGIEALDNYKKWWNQLVFNIVDKGAAHCPLCHSHKRQSPWRKQDQTLFVCQDCGTNYIYRFSGSSIKYQADYFQGHYRSVYGKDYFDDEKQIRSFSKRRLNIISNLHVHTGHDRLLDFGSAYGVFGDEASRLGYLVQGVEISEYARERALDLYELSSSEQWPDQGDTWDVITSWFTLEHIEDPLEWLRQANIRLNRNGILALGLPHGNGALARWNKKLYEKIRPQEHEFEPSLKGITRALQQSGFIIDKVEYFGLHPDRIGWPDRPMFRALQKNLGLGDTFEIYARKISSPR